MTVRDHKEKVAVPTMSVKIQWEGTLPTSLQIGYLGTFQVRQYTPDPIRCYRCQKYGHTSRTCHQTSSTCGICAGKHSTAECIEKRKTATIQPKCNNCKGAHTTASKACPVRKQKAQAIQRSTQVMQAKSEQKTTSAQAEQLEFIPTMLDFPDSQKSLKSRIPRAATTLKQTHGQTKKSYADIIKDKLVTITTQKPVVNKQTTKTKEPANKEIAKTEGPVNKSQATNSTKTPQQSEPREATVTQTYEQVAIMFIAKMQQLTPLFSVKETKAKNLIVAMIQSIQSLLRNLETML